MLRRVSMEGQGDRGAAAAQVRPVVVRGRRGRSVAEGKSDGAKQNITTWVLFLLAADGRIVRGRLLADVGRAAAVEDAAAVLTGWIGPVRVTPRFRTPWNAS